MINKTPDLIHIEYQIESNDFPCQLKLSIEGLEYIKKTTKLYLNQPVECRDKGRVLGYSVPTPKELIINDNPNVVVFDEVRRYPINEEEAELLLIEFLEKIIKRINIDSYGYLKQKQFDALCAYIFRVGLDHYERSSLSMFLKKKLYKEMIPIMLRISHRLNNRDEFQKQIHKDINKFCEMKIM